MPRRPLTKIVRASRRVLGPCWSSGSALVRYLLRCTVCGDCFVVEFPARCVITVSSQYAHQNRQHCDRDRLTTCAPDANMPKIPERDDRHLAYTRLFSRRARGSRPTYARFTHRSGLSTRATSEVVGFETHPTSLLTAASTFPLVASRALWPAAVSEKPIFASSSSSF